jgi:hypothetical protein
MAAPAQNDGVPLCRLVNDSNDVIAMILTQDGTKAQTLLSLTPKMSVTLPGSCARPPGVVGVLPSSSFVVDAKVLAQLQITPVVAISPTLQLFRNGVALVVTQKGASVAPPTPSFSSDCTFRNGSDEFLLVGGTVTPTAAITGVLLGSDGSFSMSPCPTQMAANPATSIVISSGASYFVAASKDMAAITTDAPLALCATRENGVLYSYAMTRPDANTYVIRKLGADNTPATLAANTNPTESGAPTCTTIMPLVQIGTPVAITITLAAFLIIFAVLFTVFVTLYVNASKANS